MQTRPGVLTEGFFGVFYGFKGAKTYPCAFPGCGHICLSSCLCYEVEKMWRRLWVKHHRKTPDTTATATAATAATTAATAAKAAPPAAAPAKNTM